MGQAGTLGECPERRGLLPSGSRWKGRALTDRPAECFELAEGRAEAGEDPGWAGGRGRAEAPREDGVPEALGWVTQASKGHYEETDPGWQEGPAITGVL